MSDRKDCCGIRLLLGQWLGHFCLLCQDLEEGQTCLSIVSNLRLESRHGARTKFLHEKATPACG